MKILRSVLPSLSSHSSFRAVCQHSVLNVKKWLWAWFFECFWRTVETLRAIFISHPETFHEESLVTQRYKWQEVRVVVMLYD